MAPGSRAASQWVGKSRYAWSPVSEPSDAKPRADDDLELLQRWRQGDGVAGDTLVQRYYPAVRRFFANKMGEGIDDLVQRTFLAVLHARERFREGSKVRTYVLGIARIELLRFLRKRQRGDRAARTLESSVDELTQTPGSLIAKRQEQRLLLKALRRLPLEQQMAIELHYWEHLPLAEIAEVLDVAEGTIKSRLGRARQALRERIETMEQDPQLARTTIDHLDRWAASVREEAMARRPPDE